MSAVLGAGSKFDAAPAVLKREVGAVSAAASDAAVIDTAASVKPQISPKILLAQRRVLFLESGTGRTLQKSVRRSGRRRTGSM